MEGAERKELCLAKARQGKQAEQASKQASKARAETSHRDGREIRACAAKGRRAVKVGGHWTAACPNARAPGAYLSAEPGRGLACRSLGRSAFFCLSGQVRLFPRS